MIFVVRIAGQVKNKEKDNETLRRLKMEKKFAAVLVEEDDAVRMGMVRSVAHMVAYGKVGDDFVKELNKKRVAKNGVYFLHPPRGGFKKSSRLPTPKGILGEHEDIVKLAGRML
ncbi:uL30 family ribosomal protein [Candidatus Pacearchaeota archaeon]|nr:uL30 family ribosomal protein [Candidatus Pacearchaeota archaeon]